MSTQTAPAPTAEQLASTVLIGAFDSILDNYETRMGCVAWIDASDRRCGKESAGYLCKRHEAVAARRWEKHAAKVAAQAEERERIRVARRQFDLPKWQDELARVEAQINRLDPPRPDDRAAYTGIVHPSIRRQQRAALSDSKVQKMAALWARHEELSRKIRATQEVTR